MVGPVVPDATPRSRPRPSTVVTVLLAVLAALAGLAGLALLVGRRSSSVGVAFHRIAAGQGPVRLFLPGPLGPQLPGGLRAHLVRTQGAGAPLAGVALLLLAVGVVALAVLVARHWSTRWDRGDRPRGGPRTPGWS